MSEKNKLLNEQKRYSVSVKSDLKKLSVERTKILQRTVE